MRCEGIDPALGPGARRAGHYFAQSFRIISASYFQHVIWCSCVCCFYWTEADTALHDFRDRVGDFQASNLAWDNIDNPLLFWRCMVSHFWSIQPPEFWSDQSIRKLHLEALTRRLFQTPAKSVPSERAFSTMNYLHSKIRNSLISSPVNKLQYIYINKRSLIKEGNKTFSESELLAMEDVWLQLHNTSISGKDGRDEDTEKENDHTDEIWSLCDDQISYRFDSLWIERYNMS